MTPPIRIIMVNGTIHTFRNTDVTALIAKFSNWARIERINVKQPPLMIEIDDDG